MHRTGWRSVPAAAATLLALALLGACPADEAPGGSVGGDAPDVSLPDGGISPPDGSGGDTGVDTGLPDIGDTGNNGGGGGKGDGAIVPGGFGAPCTTNAECTSGYCVEGPEGYLCTEQCVEACQDGWDCKGVVQGPDIIFLCVPVVKKLCTPCTKDFQCSEGACLSIDGQLRCAFACATTEDCPEGYACAADATGDAAHEGTYCQPVTGSCECTAPFDGSQRTCVIANEVGTCYGVETCDAAAGWGACTAATPVVEECNGKDDDCDGLVDEGIEEGAACENTVEGVGACPGISVCQGPLGLLCQGPVPSAEACDTKDNDCDGLVDEDYKGEDGEYSTDLHCGACNNDCATAIANGTGTCDAEALQCVVAECDPGFVQVNPYACAATVELPCKPCEVDEDCLGGTCEAFDDGSYCLVACQGDEQACPAGYACGELGDGTACLPQNGTCTCNALTDGKKRGCSNTSELGSCAGLETCDPAVGWTGCDAPAPAPEACNGKDDDCDNLVDEDLVPEAGCTNDVAGVGSCPGTPVCLGALGWSCQGPKPEVEACDFKDNDCDGGTDEDYKDADGKWTLEAHCGTCGNDCATKIEHGTGVCGGTPEVPLCVVQSCDEDYVKLNAFQCGLPADVSCVPCLGDDTCFGGSCVPMDGQQVCVIPCGKEAKSCPDGYACQDAGGVERCMPVSGSCTCNEGQAGETRGCKASNAFGSCFGQQTCEGAGGWSACSAVPPEPEVCNGKDDDCDGAVDDGVIPPEEPCATTNGFGTCVGIWYCAAEGGEVEWTCSAAEPALDACDYLDNDCDGITDQGFVDGEGRYVGDANCGACGVSCAGSIPNATATCKLAGDVPRCEVASCKAGYFQAGPLTCLPVADTLCQPCQTDENCPTPGDSCLPLDGASYCGRDCGAGNLHGTPEGECPAGFECVAAGPGKQCRPVSGSCACLPGDEGKTRTCLNTNGFGTCYGSQSCGAGGWGACSAAVPAAEVCNGKDDDCNQVPDDVAGRGAACQKSNGFGTCTGVDDCVAGSTALVCTAATPAAETCNGKDDDCDGQVDEAFPDLYESCKDGVGACERYGFKECKPDGTGTVCNAKAATGGAEKCNSIDDDCDGTVDEGFAGLGAVCTTGDGACKAAGITVCKADGSGVECNAKAGSGGAEQCNGVDDDCDGQTDEGLSAPACANQKGVCAGSKQTCGGLEGWRACTGPEYGASYEQTELTCDGKDNDCDGAVDDNLPPHPCPNQVGVCAGSFASCGGAAGWSTCGPTQYGAGYQATESTCDSLDNDCDGATDEGYKNAATGKYDSHKACGSCFTDCTVIFAKPQAYGQCQASGTPTCVMKCCAPGVAGCSVTNPWYDLNLVPDDGCEFMLDPAAIYVSIDDTNADDNAGCGKGPVGTGSQNRPCKSITKGIAEAKSTSRTKVLVADGLYVETVTIVDGISLLGGYRADNWERHLSTTLTTIRGNGGTGAHTQTVVVGALTKATTIEGFTIEGQDATQTSGNSYAIYASSASANLVIKNNVILAGAGGPGQDRTAAGAGTKGVNGVGRNSPGVVTSTYDAFIATGSGYCATSNNRQHSNGGQLTCPGNDNVSGGNGGGNHCEPDPNGGEGSGSDGAAGQAGAGASGGAAGGSGDAGNDGVIEQYIYCVLPSQSMTGMPGTNGAAGGNGGAGNACSSAAGNVAGGHWQALGGLTGQTGFNGGGGGGGGAGGGGYCYQCNENKDRLGAHGGGGGSGGCGGNGGNGGGGAGGSFGVFLVGSGAPTVSGNTIVRGIGGRGGAGGNGGVGGSGGNGGVGGNCPGNCFCFSDAGKGGEGGAGGHGGGGGGGCGGVSYGIYGSGIGSPAYCSGATNTILGGIAGPGGLGGLSLGNTANNGAPGTLGTCSFN